MKAYLQPGVEVIYRLNCYGLPSEREHFGFRDGISAPAVEGSGIPNTNPQQRPLKAGEFVLGYPDETGSLPPMPQPEALGHNGSYVVLRKLHQRVAAFRQYLRAQSSDRDQQELVAAKMMGRWRSGAPLVLCPERDDPELGADPKRNNNFLYGADGRLLDKFPRQYRSLASRAKPAASRRSVRRLARTMGALHH